jgi:hypothetical protein
LGCIGIRNEKLNNESNNFDGKEEEQQRKVFWLTSRNGFYILNYTSVDGNGDIQTIKKKMIHLTK